MTLVDRCPACRSSQITLLPRSQATGEVIVGCSSCGAFARAEIDQREPEVVDDQELSEQGYADYVAAKRDNGRPEAWRETARDLRAHLGPGSRLYDVGAGDGSFLDLARQEFGFDVHGNETSESAVRLAEQRHGITLELGDIGTLGHEDAFDAITMWCVLAHVPDGDRLVADAFRMLRPGGVLTLQTPHRTLVDRAALELARTSGGRVTKVSDRRLAPHHRILHTPRSIEHQLTRAGFEQVRSTPQARYSLSSELYLHFAGLRGRPQRIGARVMDSMLDRGLAPRIILDVWAVKPA